MNAVIRKLIACAVRIGTLASCAAGYGATDKEGVKDMTEMARKALALAGCDMEKLDEANPRMRERVLIAAAEFLEAGLAAKYPDAAFELVACLPYDVDQRYDEFHFTAKEIDGIITARVYTGEDDSLSFTDSYYGAVKSTEFDGLVKSLIADIEPRAAVFSTLSGQCGMDVTLDTPLDAVLSRGDLVPHAWILLPPEGGAFDDRVQAVRDALESGKLSGDFSIYLLTEQGAASAMTRAEAFERIPADRETHLVFSEFKRFFER